MHARWLARRHASHLTLLLLFCFLRGFQAKNQMQEEVESLRRRLGSQEEELETLRKALRMAEGQGGRDKEALDRLNGLLRSAEEQLKTVQATLQQEMVERRTMEARIASRQAQADQVMNFTCICMHVYVYTCRRGRMAR